MSVIMNRADVAAAMKRIADVAARGGQIPILTHMLLEQDDENGGKLRLSATDMDMTLTVRVDAQVGDWMGACLPATDLAAMVNGLPDGSQMELVMSENRCHLRSGRTRFTLPVLDPADFPRMAGGAGAAFTLEADVLSNLIARTEFAVHAKANDSRYYLKGIFMEVANDKMFCVATNAFVLARTEIPLPAGAAPIEKFGRSGVIIPRDALPYLKQMAAGPDPIRFLVNENTLSANAGPWSFITKLMAGEYPDYKRIMPDSLTENRAVFELNTAAFKSAIARVRLAVNHQDNPVLLRLTKGALSIESVMAADGREATDVVDIDYNGDAGAAWKYNAVDLRGVADAYGAEHITVAMSSNGERIPTIITVKDDPTVVITMPLLM